MEYPRGRGVPPRDAAATLARQSDDVPGPPLKLRAHVVATLLVLGAIAGPVPARGDLAHPVEHEPIPPDAANDLAFGARIDGDLPAAIETRSGLVSAPDPHAALPKDAPHAAPDAPIALAGQDVGEQVASSYVPDGDTRRPSELPYSDPFSPKTAPFKREIAFDTVHSDFSLGVDDPKLLPVPTRGFARGDGTEELFYGDLVVEMVPGQPTRIPSVGPGARILSAHLGNRDDELDFDVVHDSADNWFVQSRKRGPARLVMEIAISRAVFGGPLGEVPTDVRFSRWGSLLAEPVQRDAAAVATHIGVPRATARETVSALVDYFRGFTESEDPLPKGVSTYLALALSKHGVCRHRAYAFMVTAMSLGIRSRVVMNEAHAWVEVWDGEVWKRIDLGGAGSVLAETDSAPAAEYTPPPDPFGWPAGAARGEDLARTAPGFDLAAPATGGQSLPSGSLARPMPGDTRPVAHLTLLAGDSTATRGQPLRVHGEVLADGLPCVSAVVSILFRDTSTGGTVTVGGLATNDRGVYDGALSVPSSVPIGHYEVVASTDGTSRCGGGVSP
jgi:transglutaminase-like putative cysteine protease